MTAAVDLAVMFGSLLDRLGVPYAIGGSVAASVFGEPRTTVDIDVAVRMDRERLDALMAELGSRFYVPESAAAEAVEALGSFNVLDSDTGLKVDVFVLGDSPLDRRQIDRRWLISIQNDPPTSVWVTSPEDIVLRKLEWFALTDETSERQWRDIVGLLRHQRDDLDWTDLRDAADVCGLSALLQRAESDAAN